MIDNHTVYLHRFILQIEDENDEVDHHDGYKLNNRRENLITMSKKENLEKAWYSQGLYKTNKPVYMIDKDTNSILKEFESTREAEKYLKANGQSKARQGNISSACIGRLKTLYGYKWIYKEEYHALYGQ